MHTGGPGTPDLRYYHGAPAVPKSRAIGNLAGATAISWVSRISQSALVSLPGTDLGWANPVSGPYSNTGATSLTFGLAPAAGVNVPSLALLLATAVSCGPVNIGGADYYVSGTVQVFPTGALSINLPFPILLSAYGDEAFPFALMFYLASLLGIFTIGLLIASGGKGAFQVFREPVLYSIACALFMNLQGVPIPEILIQPLGLLESAAIPMVLLVLGMQLSRVKIQQWKLPMIAVSLRLGGGLLAAFVCIWGFGLTDLVRKVVLLEAVMPSAIMTALVAEKYKTDSELVASAVVLSTLISIVVIPLTLYLNG